MKAKGSVVRLLLSPCVIFVLTISYASPSIYICIYIYLLLYASQVTLNVVTAAQAIPMIYYRHYITAEAGAGNARQLRRIAAKMNVRNSLHFLAPSCAQMCRYQIAGCEYADARQLTKFMPRTVVGPISNAMAQRQLQVASLLPSTDNKYLVYICSSDSVYVKTTTLATFLTHCCMCEPPCESVCACRYSCMEIAVAIADTVTTVTIATTSSSVSSWS